MLKNTSENYGWLAVGFHWITALAILGLFASGLWMVGLTYYSHWYNTAPHWHRSIGILLIVIVFARLIWRFMNLQPRPLSTHRTWEANLARLAHWLLYLVTIVVLASGFMISTAKGQPIEIFNWFSVPALITGEGLGVVNLEDKAGEIHEILAWVLIGITALHTLAALKHHFVDKDNTMARILGINKLK